MGISLIGCKEKDLFGGNRKGEKERRAESSGKGRDPENKKGKRIKSGGDKKSPTLEKGYEHKGIGSEEGGTGKLLLGKKVSGNSRKQAVQGEKCVKSGKREEKGDLCIKSSNALPWKKRNREKRRMKINNREELGGKRRKKPEEKRKMVEKEDQKRLTEWITSRKEKTIYEGHVEQTQKKEKHGKKKLTGKKS